jgi:hypothetical protein
MGIQWHTAVPDKERIIAAKEYRRSTCEGFKCDYKVVCALKNSEIASVIINCNSATRLVQ